MTLHGLRKISEANAPSACYEDLGTHGTIEEGGVMYATN
jgi:hypothetical protein